MLEAWSISRRVSTGFALLTLIIIGLSVFSQRPVGTLGNGYVEYREAAKQSIAAAAYMEDIFEARVAALKYFQEPSDIWRQEVINNITEVTEVTALRAAFANSPDRLREVEQLVGISDQFSAGFIDMAAQIEIATQAQSRFNAQTTDLKTAVDGIFLATIQTSSPSLITAAARSLQSAMSAILSGKQFLRANDPDELTTFTAEFDRFLVSLRRLEALNSQDAIATQITTLKANLDGYPAALGNYGTAMDQAIRIQETVLNVLGTEVQDGLDVIVSEILTRQNQLGPVGSAIVERLQFVIPQQASPLLWSPYWLRS